MYLKKMHTGLEHYIYTNLYAFFSSVKHKRHHFENVHQNVLFLFL